MTLLVDKDLEKLVKAGQLVKNIFSSDGTPLTGSIRSPVQPASIDLHIGCIYRPGTNADGSPLSGVQGGFTDDSIEYWLGPGETAVVTTYEVLEMPITLAGYGFPPASLALNGLLMTNPGHIDPGFSGSLSFTIINMGHAKHMLKRGMPIMTMMVTPLTERPQKSYRELEDAPPPPTSRPSPSTLARLSKDFLDLENRSRSVALATLEQRERKRDWIPSIVTAFTFLFAIYFGLISPLIGVSNDLAALKERSAKNLELSQRLERLEKANADLTAELSEIRRSTPANRE